MLDELRNLLKRRWDNIEVNTCEALNGRTGLIWDEFEALTFVDGPRDKIFTSLTQDDNFNYVYMSVILDLEEALGRDLKADEYSDVIEMINEYVYFRVIPQLKINAI